MAATYTAEHLKSRSLRRMLDFDPDSGSEVIATLNPSASEKGIALNLGYRRFLFGIMRSVGTGQLSAVRVLAAENAAITTNATVVTSATPTTADAVGDTVWYEVDIEQIKEVLSTATHVGLGITLQTSTDECVVFVEAADGQFQYTGLTANYIQ